MSKSFWKKLLGLFLEKENIEDFHVMGFSLGARLALTSFEMFPSKVKKLYLLAPDGIQDSIWFRIATGFWWGKKLFQFL